MIDQKNLKDSDVGRWVEYWPSNEIGRIKSWNTRFVFVVYKCNNDWENFKNYTATATHSRGLDFKELEFQKEGTQGVLF